MPVLSEREIDKKLSEFVDWDLVDHGEISRTFEKKNFKEALDFVNKIGNIAESANHHPDILIHDYNMVTLTLSTHKEGGLTEKDFKLAGEIDNLS
jgi:4a-hydroxytetrahydrobiopterin dehydratase